MSFFDWLKRLFGGQPASPPPGQVPMARLVSPPPAPKPFQRISGKKLNLDPGNFAPITHDQARQQAQALGGRAWMNPWFGRRDLIPPADDPRTSVIDRAMVAHGLLTPEDLVRIHKIGQQMDEIRPDLALATTQGERAVAADRDAKAARKAQKKAEAAEKKKRRSDDIARRRATDIVFLGRGVSKGLADRRAHVENLQAAGLPILAAPADVATALGLTIPRLRWLAFHSEASATSHYVRFTVPKKSGGTRELASPRKSLRAAQSWILENILNKVPLHAAAHGFVKGRSTLTNATPHVAHPVVVNADLRDFFPTITFPRVLGIFTQLGYSPAAATVLALLTTECPRRLVEYEEKKLHVACGPRALPQGACTSPALSNLAARSLDRRMQAYATKLGWTMTRYADDITLSGSDSDLAGRILARLRHCAQEEGFEVNEKKTRVQRPSSQQSVTGVVVNAKPSAPRKLRRRLRAILHQAKKSGFAAANVTREERFEAKVRGAVSYVAMLNAEQGAKLKASLAQVR